MCWGLGASPHILPSSYCLLRKSSQQPVPCPPPRDPGMSWARSGSVVSSSSSPVRVCTGSVSIPVPEGVQIGNTRTGREEETTKERKHTFSKNKRPCLLILHHDWQIMYLTLLLGTHILRCQRQRPKELKPQCDASRTKVWEAQKGRDQTLEGIPGKLPRGGG